MYAGVYDVTDFLAIHPGGAGVLAGLGGKDATDFFDELHRPEVLTEIAAEYKIGVIGEAPASEAPAPSEGRRREMEGGGDGGEGRGGGGGGGGENGGTEFVSVSGPAAGGGAAAALSLLSVLF